MLSILDPIIFPDDCLILKSQDHYIYPIFKNGSSSLKQSGYTVVSPDEYADISEITVFVREPFERYLSGVNTFVQHNPSYHQETLVHIISENLFLNYKNYLGNSTRPRAIPFALAIGMPVISM